MLAPNVGAEGGNLVLDQLPLGAASHDLSGHGFNRAENVAANDSFRSAEGMSGGATRRSAIGTSALEQVRAGTFDSCRYAAAARQPSAEWY